MEETKIYYKGFEKGLVCRGHQYKEGEWEHIADEAILCKQGVHACEAPLDCFNYYPPDTSEYHEVEMGCVSNCESGDSKICATDIKVGANLNIAGIVKAQIEYIKSKVAATSGDGANAATSGNGANAATSGDGANAATSGDGANAATSGYGANAATSGDGANAATSGYGANAATSGYRANAATSGDGATSVSTGIESRAEVNANDSIAIAWGKDCKAKGIIGSHLVIAERGAWNGKTYPLLGVKMVAVDGKFIKADTWYKLVSGELVEVE